MRMRNSIPILLGMMIVISFVAVLPTNISGDGGWLESNIVDRDNITQPYGIVKIGFKGNKTVGVINAGSEIINGSYRYVALIDNNYPRLYNGSNQLLYDGGVTEIPLNVTDNITFINAVKNDTRFLMVKDDHYIYMPYLNGSARNITASFPFTTSTVILGAVATRGTDSGTDVYMIPMLTREYSITTNTYYYNATVYIINADNYTLTHVIDCFTEHIEGTPTNLYIYDMDVYYNATDNKIFFAYGNYYNDGSSTYLNFTVRGMSFNTEYVYNPVAYTVSVSDLSYNEADFIDIGFVGSETNKTLYATMIYIQKSVTTFGSTETTNIIAFTWNWTTLTSSSYSSIYITSFMVAHNETCMVERYLGGIISSNIYILTTLEGYETALTVDDTLYDLSFNKNIILGDDIYYIYYKGAWMYRSIAVLYDIGIHSLESYIYGVDDLSVPKDATWITGLTYNQTGSEYIYPERAGAYLVYVIYGSTWIPFTAIVNAVDTPFIDYVIKDASIDTGDYNAIQNGIGNINGTYFYMYSKIPTASDTTTYINVSFSNGTIAKYNSYNNKYSSDTFLLFYNESVFSIYMKLSSKDGNEYHIIKYSWNSSDYINETDVTGNLSSKLIDVYYANETTYCLTNDYNVYTYTPDDGLEFAFSLGFNSTYNVIAWDTNNNTISSNSSSVYINNQSEINNYLYDVSGIFDGNFYYFNYTNAENPLSSVIYHCGNQTINTTAPLYIEDTSLLQRHLNTTPLHIYDRSYYLSTKNTHYLTLIDTNHLPLVLPEINIHEPTPLGISIELRGIAQIDNDTIVVMTNTAIYRIEFNISTYAEKSEALLLTPIDIELDSGWNFISIPTPEILVSTLFEQYTNLTPVIVVLEHNNTGNRFIPFYYALNYTDYTIKNATPVFIFAKQTVILHLQVKLLEVIDYEVQRGWNAIGLPYNYSRPVNLFCEDTNATIVVNSDYTPYLYGITPGTPYYMQTYEGYFVYYNETKNFTL